jgi:hypothetical protein
VPSGPTTNKLRFVMPGRLASAPNIFPTTAPVSLAIRYGNWSSRAHAASVSTGSALIAISTTSRPSLKSCAY